MTFTDLFSKRARLYSVHRPSYPEGLFTWIASLVPERSLAWDCATGNGQAARGLAAHFRKVIATDASASQISMAEPHPSIEYRVATAYASGLLPASADVVTVAQAMHWLELDPFYAEVDRVLSSRGAIVIWGYDDPVLDSDDLHSVVHEYSRELVGRHWRPERAHVLDGYRSLTFPFREIEPPSFTMEREWTLDELAGYIRTWSATAAYAAEHGIDPVVDLEARLSSHWGKKQERHLVRWPLFVRAGYLW